jgi:hypothetical protein
MRSSKQSFVVFRIQFTQDCIGVTKSWCLLSKIVETQATISVQLSNFSFDFFVSQRFACINEQLNAFRKHHDRLLVSFFLEMQITSFL